MLEGVICNTCGREVKLVCADCRAERSYQGLLLHQRRFLQTWESGALDLRVRYQDNVRHLELFDARWHAFCGATMFQPTPRERVRALPADTCASCVQVFERLVAASREEL
jgi:hypothetical protein